MLDRLSPQWRHIVILLIGAVLTYAADQVAVLPAQWRPFAAAAVAIVTLAVTPLTRQYGVGVVDEVVVVDE